MKLKFIPILIIIFIYSCSFFNPKNDLPDWELKGNVSKVIITKWSAIEKFGEAEKEHISSNDIIKFNKSGQIVERENTSLYDSLPTTHTITSVFYNDKGLKTGYNGKTQLGKSKFSKFSGTYKYDNNNSIVEANNFDDGKLSSVNKYVYNQNSLLKEINSYSMNGALNNKTVYKQNEYKLASEIADYDSTGLLIYKQFINYDKEKRVVAIKVTGKYPSKYTFTYPRIDNHGNWLTQIEYDNGKPDYIVERKIEYY